MRQNVWQKSAVRTGEKLNFGLCWMNNKKASLRSKGGKQ